MRTRKRTIEPAPDEGKADNGAKKRKTLSRNETLFLVGKASKMNSNQLPTRADVIKHFLYLKEKHGHNSANGPLIGCSFTDKFRNV